VSGARAAAMAAGLFACAPAGHPRTVSLRMTGTPPEAQVTIDDEVVGSLAVVAARGVALPRGAHRVTVEAPGYFPWDREVIADPRASASPLRLAVALERLPR